jgi:hypothetical protein
MAKFDDSGYDAIVFDKICSCSVRNLERIKRYCECNPDKIVVATGARTDWDARTASRTRTTTANTTTSACV